MFKHLLSLMILMPVILLLLSAPPGYAVESGTISDAGPGADAAIASRITHPGSPTLLFALPVEKVQGFLDGLGAASSGLQFLFGRLDPVATRAVFVQFADQAEPGIAFDAFTFKPLDNEAMFDWEIAVAGDLESVAVAINFRF